MELPIKVNGVVVFNDKVLVIKRVETDGGFWQTVTGTVEDGEKLKDTLIREIAEEVGITDIDSISDVIHKFTWDKKGWPQTEFVYVVTVTSNRVQLSPEHDDFMWLSFEDAVEKVKTENNKEVINKAYQWRENSSAYLSAGNHSVQP